jgi:hypothetical protein
MKPCTHAWCDTPWFPLCAVTDMPSDTRVPALRATIAIECLTTGFNGNSSVGLARDTNQNRMAWRPECPARGLNHVNVGT